MKIKGKKIKSLFFLSLLNNTSGNEEFQNQTGISYPTGVNLMEMLKGLNHSQKFVANGEKIPAERSEQQEQNLLVAGSPISVVIGKSDGSTLQSKCTSSFMIVNTNSSDCVNHNDYGGFLTAYVSCFPSAPSFTGLSKLKEVFGWDGSVLLGNFPYYWSSGGTDYLYVSANLANVKLIPFVMKVTEEKTELIPVISSANPTSLGAEVCIYGAGSSYRCGNLTAVGLSLTVPNPWGWSPNLDLNGLDKVDLGTNGLLSEDIGAPVYAETQIGERTLAQALGHVSWIDNNDPHHQSFYFTSLEQTLGDISDKDFCTYTLLTYNEENAEEWQELQAQILVPPKNS